MSKIRSFLSGRRAAMVALQVLAAGLLAACADRPQLAPPMPDMFDDAHVAPAKEPIDTADVFRVTPEMQAYLDKYIAPVAKRQGLREAIGSALYDRSKLKLQYDATMTRNAHEAFEARQGNCLSLVIMTGAIAKALNMVVTYQQVETEAMLSRAGTMYFYSGHVNLLLQRSFADASNSSDSGGVYTIDFMPDGGKGLKARPISEDTVLAMYMNNRSAEALVHGQLDDAYWRVRESIRRDPQFLSAYNTLGVVYLRRGDLARAERVLNFALQAAPDSPQLLTNYVQALRKLGRTAEADIAQAHLTAVEPTPPFYWFVQGEAALHRGDYLAARALFLKEIDRAPDYHEFHYGLAVADFQLGRLDEARREMKLAMEGAVKRTDHDLYAAKLDKLNAWRANQERSTTSVQ